VGAGARCVTCGEQRRRVLRTVELHAAWHPMCFNCAGQLILLEQPPTNLAALREAVSRERRRLERRFGKPDTRVFRYERRVGERRGERDGYDRIDDDMIIEVSVESSDDAMELDFEDVTMIHELVPEPAAHAAE
jgi:hypothetical protein